ncbi:MAG TPA: hypothetical protein ENF87_01330, partial [Thermoproteales archaeon]|nr:hypothetical protein [Thermoproteales archaeon]
MSFKVVNGCFYFKEKPFIKTSAYGGGDYLISLPEDNVEDPGKNLYLRAGFTAVEFWARWGEVEPQDGVWDLDGLKRLLKRARRMGIGVFIHFDPSPPSWMSKKHGWYVVTETGKRKLIPYMGIVPHDENYSRELEEYVKRIIDVVKEYEDVVVDYWLCGEKWVLVPEFNSTEKGVEDVSYDEYTITEFREWLRKQFSLEEIGENWNFNRDTYSSWEEVYPPKGLKMEDFMGKRLSNWRSARWDWYRFKQHLYVKVWKNFCDLVYKYDPHRPISLEINMDLPGFIGHGRWYKVCSLAKNAHAGIQDFEATFERALYYIAVSKGSSKPPYQVNEMSGFQDYKWCIRHTWFIQAMGGTGMTFWDFKSDYWGLVTGKGRKYLKGEKVQFKESYLAVQELNKIFRSIMDILGASSPPPQSIGILFLDEDSFHESGVAVAPAMRYLKHLLWNGYGCETSIVTEEHLERGSINSYRVVIAPHIKYISLEHAEALKKYVEKGGILIVGAFAGEFDERGNPYNLVPCKPLSELLGLKAKVDLDKEVQAHLARVREYLPIRFKPGSWIMETIPPRLEGDLRSVLRRTGINLDPKAREGWNFLSRYIEGKYKETLVVEDIGFLKKGEKLKCIPVQRVIPEEAKVLCTCENMPTLTLNKYGKGYVFYLPAVYDEESLSKILGTVLQLAGLKPYVEVYSPIKQGVIWGVRKASNGFILIIIEVADRQQEINIKLNTSRMGLKEFEILDLLNHNKMRLHNKNSKFVTQIRICEAKIYQ